MISSVELKGGDKNRHDIAQGIEQCFRKSAVLLPDSDMIDKIEGLNHLRNQFAAKGVRELRHFSLFKSLVFLPQKVISTFQFQFIPVYRDINVFLGEYMILEGTFDTS